MPQMCSTKLIVFKLITIFFWVRNSDSFWKKKIHKILWRNHSICFKVKESWNHIWLFQMHYLMYTNLYNTKPNNTKTKTSLSFIFQDFFLLINSMDFKQSEILLHVIKQWNVAIFEHQPFCLSREICLKEKSLQYYLK